MNSLRLVTRFRATALPTRALSTSAVSRADIITDLYLKSIREHKPKPAAASDSEGQVKAWSPPAAPSAPQGADAASITSELDAYASADATADAPATSAAGAAASKSTGKDGDWFELDTTPDHVHH